MIESAGMSSTDSIISARYALVAGLARRERHAAVAEHDGRDAVPARRRADRVPGELRVEVGVDVDEARRDEPAVGVDLAVRRARRPRRRPMMRSPSIATSRGDRLGARCRRRPFPFRMTRSCAMYVPPGQGAKVSRRSGEGGTEVPQEGLDVGPASQEAAERDRDRRDPPRGEVGDRRHRRRRGPPRPSSSVCTARFCAHPERRRDRDRCSANAAAHPLDRRGHVVERYREREPTVAELGDPTDGRRRSLRPRTRSAGEPAPGAARPTGRSAARTSATTSTAR